VNDFIMLDTSGYILFKRGHAQVIQAMQKASNILISTIVIGELLSGFEKGSRTAQNKTSCGNFYPVQEFAL
jgi:predicted nucleic acid-binding protein